MAYNFGQMFQKKGIQGQAGGGVPSYPPTPTKPPVPQAGGGKPGQQFLGPPVQEPGAGTGPDGGPTYHPGPIGPPIGVGGTPTKPPRPGYQGPGMVGQIAQNPGGQWGMLPPGGGRPPAAPPPAPPQGRASPMTMPDGTTAYIWNGKAYPYDPTDPANSGIPDPYAPQMPQGGGGGRLGVANGFPYFNPGGGMWMPPGGFSGGSQF